MRERMTETEFASIVQGRFTPSDLDEYKRRKHEKPRGECPTCGSMGCEPSIRHPRQCEFCDGTLGGVNDETNY